MALLNKREVKALRQAPLMSRVMYIFAMRLYADNKEVDFGNVDEEGMLDECAERMVGLMTPDGAIDQQGLDERLSALLAGGSITPSDSRKIRGLLL